MEEIKKEMVLEVDAEQAKTSIKEIRKEIKRLQDEMANLEEGSQEFLEVASAAGELKHKIDEIKESTNGASADFGDLMSAGAKAGAGLLGAFQSVKGAMTLLGVESETVEKAIQKMQASMAIIQGVQAIDNGIKGFKKLSTAIKVATASTNSFKKALIGTGIGALVVLIGTLIANLDDLKKAFGDAGQSAENFKKTQEQIVGVYKQQKTEADEASKHRIALLKAEGKSTLEILEAEKNEAYKLWEEENFVYDIRLTTEQNEKLQKEHNDRLVVLERNKILTEKALETAQREEREKLDAEEIKKQKENLETQYRLTLSKHEKEWELTEQGKSYTLSYYNKLLAFYEKDSNDYKNILIQKNEYLKNYYENAKAITKEQLDDMLEMEKSMHEEGWEYTEEGITVYKKYFADLKELYKNNENELTKIIISENNYHKQVLENIRQETIDYKEKKKNMEELLQFQEKVEKITTQINLHLEQYTKKVLSVGFEYEELFEQVKYDYFSVANAIQNYERSNFEDAINRTRDTSKLAKQQMEDNSKLLDTLKDIRESYKLLNDELANGITTTGNIKKEISSVFEVFNSYMLSIDSEKGTIQLAEMLGITENDVKNIIDNIYLVSDELIEQVFNKIPKIADDIEKWITEQAPELLQQFVDSSIELFNLLLTKEEEQKVAFASIWEAGIEGLNAFNADPAWSTMFQNFERIGTTWGENIDKIKKGSKDATQAAFDMASTGIYAVGSILSTVATETDATSKEGFEKQKQYSTAAAIVNMLGGIVGAWSSAMNPMNSWMTPFGQIAMGTLLTSLMTAAGIMQIQKIQSTEYNSSSVGSTSSISSTALASALAPSTSQAMLTGISSDTNLDDQRVYVVESDITRSQNKVAVTESEATY